MCVDAPAQDVGAALSDLPWIHCYVDAIRTAYCTSERNAASALCGCASSRTESPSRTRWWPGEEGTSFTYGGEGVPMVRHDADTWRVEAAGSQTLVTTVSEVEVRGGPRERPALD